jgi:hypothetical protein
MRIDAISKTFQMRFNGERSYRCEPAFALLIAMLFALPAAAKKSKKASGPPPDVPGQINYYGIQLPGVDTDDAGPIASKIEQIILGDLDKWAAARTPTFVEMRQHLDQDLGLLRFPLSGESTAMPESWQGKNILLAGYTIGWNDFNRVSVIAVYVEENGATKRAATAQFVPRCDVSFLEVPQSSSTNFRFITYGLRLGKSHPRLSAILYSFDGQSLKPLWERKDDYDGKITVSGDQVVVQYLNETEFIQATEQKQLPPRHEAIYKFSPAGLDLLTIHDIPF